MNFSALNGTFSKHLVGIICPLLIKIGLMCPCLAIKKGKFPPLSTIVRQILQTILNESEWCKIISILNQNATTDRSFDFHILFCLYLPIHLFQMPPSNLIKVENILKGSLDTIPSPSHSVKIQIMGGKVCLSCKGQTLLGIVNKLLKTKGLLTSPSNVLPYYLK